MKSLLLIKILTLLILTINVNAQNQWCGFDDIPYDTDESRGTRKSSNGYWLPAHGELRVLVAFLEMVYADPSLDPSPNGTVGWPAGQLPDWADDLFDHATPTGIAQGVITRYFQDASSGNKILIGDYLVSPDNGGVFQVQTTNGNVSSSNLTSAINAKLGYNIITANGYNSITDFDNWTTTGQGLPKVQPGNNKWDNVIFIVRNSLYPGNGNGFAGTSLSSYLLGYQGDAVSVQSTHGNIPTNILRHEYAHFLLGGNNFHAGGGGWGTPNDYWIPQIGGWSMLGLYGCSFTSWNAWDRQRMGWDAPGNQFNPSARNSSNTFEVNGDLDASNPDHAGIYTLRDFVTTGDAIRIKLPFIDPDNEYQQWIWVENRQGIAVNNNPFDQWQYQSSHPNCVVGSVPGLGIYIQIDKEIRESNSASLVFGGHAGYIRPLPANGFWDRNFPTQTVFNDCVSWSHLRAFQRLYPNPFTGGGDQEAYTWDLDQDGLINGNDQLANLVEESNGQYYKNLFELGHAEHIFTLNGNNKLSISGNPSSVPLMNKVSRNYPPPVAPNVRKIYLNGVSVEILSQDQDGNIQVQIRFDDVDITDDVRWCADEIILNPITTQNGYSLNLKSGNSITIDQGLTATRMSNPVTFEGKQVFTSPTYFRVKADALINIEPDSEFIVKNGSTLKLDTGSKLVVNNNSNLVIMEGSHLIVDDCAALSILGIGKLIVENGATLHLSMEANLFFSKGFENIEIAGGAIIAPGTINPVDVIFPYLAIATEVNINNGQFFMPEILQIKEGGKLTLNNTTLVFSMEESRIQIENGGEMIVENSLLTSLCQTHWQGIEIWGNRNVSQFPLPGQPNAQGLLVLKNGAVIENAYNAITTKKNGPGWWSTTGGIVQANDAFFINNRRSVEFLSYQNKHPNSGNPLGNRSYFKNCHFEINEDYIISNPFETHISMWEVDGINIRSCNFINNPNAPLKIGSGIYTIDANFNILPTCSEPVVPCPEQYMVPNIFQGFYTGIEASCTGGNSKTIYVKDAEFIGNSYGVKLNAVNNATVIKSKFNVGTNSRDEEECNFLYGIGIELINCNGYAIEDNEFEGGHGAPGTDYIGVRVFGDDEFDTQPNLIYRNQFNQFSRANLADGRNIGFDNPFHGLSYFCNINTNNYYDFYVEQSDWGIAINQGSQTKAAGNIFSKHSAPTGSDFTNLARWPVIYWYYDNDPMQQPENVIYVYPDGTSAQNLCPSNHGSEPGTPEMRMLTETEKSYYEQLYTESTASLNSVNALYAALVDGGDTEALQAEVEMAWPDNMWELRAELLGKSPHLSQEVLIAASDKTDVLPDYVIFEVLAANPDELRKEELLEYLEEKADPLPQFMIEILRGLAANVTYKTLLQSLITGYGASKAEAAHTLLRDMLNDNTASLSDVRSLMAAMQSLPMDYQIVESYLQEGSAGNALALANMLPLLYNISGEALDEHNRYMALKQLQANLITEERNIFQLSGTEKELLENLVEESKGIVATQARSILAFVYGASYCDCPSPITDNLKRKPVASPALLHKVYEPEISARPNPAKTWVSFSYKLTGDKPQAVLEITNAQGKMIHSVKLNGNEGRYVWDTRNIIPGVYYYTLKSEKSAKSGKLIISR